MAARRYGFKTPEQIHELLTYEEESMYEMLGTIVGLAQHWGL